MSTELTRKQFLEVTNGRPHDYETHHSWGAVCYWTVDGKTYEEHQPDIGAGFGCRWFVSN